MSNRNSSRVIGRVVTAAKSLNNLFKGEATGTNRVAPILDLCGSSDPRKGVELDLAHHLLEEETEQFLYRNALTNKYIPVAKNNNSIGDPSDSDGIADVDSSEEIEPEDPGLYSSIPFIRTPTTPQHLIH